MKTYMVNGLLWVKDGKDLINQSVYSEEKSQVLYVQIWQSNFSGEVFLSVSIRECSPNGGLVWDRGNIATTCIPGQNVTDAVSNVSKSVIHRVLKNLQGVEK